MLLSWNIHSIYFNMDIFDMQNYVDVSLFLKWFYNTTKFLVELSWKMVFVVLFYYQILEWIVVTSLWMTIRTIFVVRVQTIPLIFTHFNVSQSFWLCDLCNSSIIFSHFLCVSWNDFEHGSIRPFKVMYVLTLFCTSMNISISKCS